MTIKDTVNRWLGNNQKAITLPNHAAVPSQLLWHLMGGVPVIWYTGNTDTYLRKGFEGNHVVFTIADWCARKLAAIPPILYDTKDEGAAKDYKFLRKHLSIENIAQAQKIKARAFVEVREHKILDVLMQPNELMPYDEFMYGWYIFKKFVGKADIQGIATTGVNPGIANLYLLPSNYIQAVAGQGLTVIDHFIDTRQPSVHIPTEQILEIRNFSANYQSAGAQLQGMSVMQAASKLLTKSNDSLSAQAETLQNRGARGILAPNLSGADLAGLQLPSGATMDTMNAEMRKRLSEAGNQGVITHSIPMSYISIGMTSVEMQTLESDKLDNAAWASLFHVDSRVVLNDHQSSTKDNMQTARLDSILDGVLPEAEAFKNGINAWMLPTYDNKGRYYFDMDYTVLPEIQRQLRDTAKEMSDAGIFTPNEIREVWKYDAYPHANANKILVATTKQLLDDMDSSLPDVENTGDYQ